MTREQMLLTILIEECNETAQRASKAIRFGLDDIQEGQHLDNAQRLIYEFNDIIGVMEFLHAENYIPYHIDGIASGLKKLKIDQWLRYSEERGKLNNKNKEG